MSRDDKFAPVDQEPLAKTSVSFSLTPHAIELVVAYDRRKLVEMWEMLSVAIDGIRGATARKVKLSLYHREQHVHIPIEDGAVANEIDVVRLIVRAFAPTSLDSGGNLNRSH